MADKPIASNLPADLPTNWQTNQIVSPNGTEVGLNTQHGFNYLARQVNDAQAGVNAINNAFPGLAAATHTHTPAQIGADPSGSAAAVQASLNAHTGRMDNPHGVTAAQIGAVTWKTHDNGITAADMNNANFPYSYETSISDGSAIGLPAGWWHIKYFRHGDNNGFGTQIALGLNVGNQMYFRTSGGTEWHTWDSSNAEPLMRLHTGLGNEYIWEKYTTHPDGTKVVLNNYLFLQNSNPTTFPIYYADSFTVISDTNGLKFQLVNPSTLGFTTNNVVTGDPLKGKYCLVNNYTPLMYIPPEAVFTTPNGAGLQVFVSVCTKYGAPTNKKTVHSYVNSTNPTAYPISDGYLYNSLGKLGNRSWALSGSYMGTGVYGSANPNVLTFPSEPKLFMVQCATSVGDNNFPRGLTITSNYCTDFMLWTPGQKNYSIQSQGAASANNHIDSGQNSLSWYSVNNAQCQMNVLSMVYYYVAIGG